MEFPTFFFVAHAGKAFVYREHYHSSAEMNAAAFDVHQIARCFVCTVTRKSAPKLAFVKRKGKYPGLHLLNPKQGRGFAA